jgi:ribosomal protein S25
MTAPAPNETIEREQDKLYVTDAEMIRRMGVPEKLARPVIRELDEQP